MCYVHVLAPQMNVNIITVNVYMKRMDEEIEGEERKQWKGKEKRIKMCYVHVSTACKECKHYVLQINKENVLKKYF